MCVFVCTDVYLFIFFVLLFIRLLLGLTKNALLLSHVIFFSWTSSPVTSSSFWFQIILFFLFSFVLQKSFIDSPSKAHLKCVSQVVVRASICMWGARRADGVAGGQCWRCCSEVWPERSCTGSLRERPASGEGPPQRHPLLGAAHDQGQEVPPEDIQVSSHVSAWTFPKEPSCKISILYTCCPSAYRTRRKFEVWVSISFIFSFVVLIITHLISNFHPEIVSSCTKCVSFVSYPDV